MKDGRYAMQFSADGYVDDGVLSIERDVAVGSGRGVWLEGDVVDAGQKLTATLSVSMDPGTLKNTRVAGAFQMTMHGAIADGGFNLYGVGPLGLIVEIVAGPCV